eukprot:scaffold35964_cov50-Phaeocystis_antarctica.AAC.2
MPQDQLKPYSRDKTKCDTGQAMVSGVASLSAARSSLVGRKASVAAAEAAAAAAIVAAAVATAAVAAAVAAAVPRVHHLTDEHATHETRRRAPGNAAAAHAAAVAAAVASSSSHGVAPLHDHTRLPLRIALHDVVMAALLLVVEARGDRDEEDA